MFLSADDKAVNISGLIEGIVFTLILCTIYAWKGLQKVHLVFYTNLIPPYMQYIATAIAFVINSKKSRRVLSRAAEMVLALT